MEIIIFFFVVAVVYVVIKLIYISSKKTSMVIKLSAQSDFSPSHKVMGEDGNSGIAVDEGRKKVCLINKHVVGSELDILSYRDILSSEVFEDGETVTKTARVSQLGGTLIGGLVLGGVGAVIGGLTGKKISSGKVKKIDLRITVNRTKNPIHDINFMDVECKKGGYLYNQAMKKARHWHGVMEVLINRADSEDDAKQRELAEESPKLISTGSVADELAKLGELKKQGLLTDEEFLSQKTKLLS